MLLMAQYLHSYFLQLLCLYLSQYLLFYFLLHIFIRLDWLALLLLSVFLSLYANDYNRIC